MNWTTSLIGNIYDIDNNLCKNVINLVGINI